MKRLRLVVSMVVLAVSFSLFSKEADACYYFKGELNCIYRSVDSFSVRNSDIETLINNGVINWTSRVIQKSKEISIVKLKDFPVSPKVELFPAVFVENGELLALTGEIGVVFKPGVAEKTRFKLIEKYGLEIARTIDGIEGFYVFKLDGEHDPFNLSVEIYETGLVKWAQPVWLEKPQLNSMPNDIYYSYQWQHKAINSEKAWSVTKGDPDAKIAVVDSGVDTNHPDLRLAWGHSFVPAEQYVDPNMGAFQNQYIMAHGTCVAGIAAAIGFNEWGVAGVCADCTVIPIKYIGLEQNHPPLDRKLHAMKWAVDEGAWIINNSWVVAPDKNRQTDTCIEVPSDNFLVEAVDYAVNYGRGGLGTIIVWAAGNSTCDTMLNKSLQDDRTVTVAGLDTDLTHVYYSNYGVAVDIAAPAGDSMPGKSGLVTTDVTVPNKGFNPAYNNANKDYDDFHDQFYTKYFDGTSAAAPVVSGALALMLSVRPGMTYQEAIACMKSAAAEPAANCQHGSKETCFGAGILDVGKMVEMAFNGDCGGGEEEICFKDEHCKENEICDFETKSCKAVENNTEEPDDTDIDDPGSNDKDSDNNDTDDGSDKGDSSNEDKDNSGDKNGDKSIDDEKIGCSIIFI